MNMNDRNQSWVLVGIGGTGNRIMLEALKDMPGRVLGLALDTDVEGLQRLEIPSELADRVETVATTIPRWTRERVRPGEYDDYAALRAYQRQDRPFLADRAGAEGRHESVMALLDSESRGEISSALRRAVYKVGVSDGNARGTTVGIVTIAFGGRGTGAGMLPTVGPIIRRVQDLVSGDVDTRSVAVVQQPTLLRSEYGELQRRFIVLAAELSAEEEGKGISILPGYQSRGRSAFDDIVVVGNGTGWESRPRGFEPDEAEVVKHTAAIVRERCSGRIHGYLQAEEVRRRELVATCDHGTNLPRLFTSAGAAELLLETDEATNYGAKWLEHSLYQLIAGTTSRA